MESNTFNIVEEENKLYKVAKKSAAFKYNVLSFILVNIFLWSLWLFYFKSANNHIMPWPLWPMLMWGVAIFYTYIKTYFPLNSFREKEYSKLKNKQQ
jgi:2TM domain